ncbi:MAG: D-2-hydroxyacid dehydrogenase [Streptosporangiales bacterium]|nr:D-2-hydroxyacid dehydrogenase [Streptosporangiales bacterium]
MTGSTRDGAVPTAGQTADSTLNVLVAGTFEADDLTKIEAAGPSVRLYYRPDLLPEAEYGSDHDGHPRDLTEDQLATWRRLLAVADVTLGIDWWDPAGMRENCPRLRWIQGVSSGMAGHLAKAGLSIDGLTVTTAAGVHGGPLAEFALTGILHFVKNVPMLREAQRGHRWDRHVTPQLYGRRALVVGLGAIGARTVALLDALGVEVWGAGRPGRARDVPGMAGYVEYTRLAEALPETDVLVLAVPLTAETKGLVGERELTALRPGAIVVNMGRGGVLDEDALVAALDAGRLRGAVLDVFATEPLPTGSPLWDRSDVLMSPHSAAAADAENSRIVTLFADNLRRYLDGRPLRNVYDPERGY